MPSELNKIRVLVVDDSAVMRKLIPSLLEKDEEIEVIATAIDGDFALNKVEQLKPDVVTLDVDMPRMDGITVLERIMSRSSVPVVMLSSLTTRGASLTMKALGAGAVDFVCKPKGMAQIGDVAVELIAKVKGAARIRRVVPRGVTGNLSLSAYENFIGHSRAELGRSSVVPGRSLIAIGASSGGPHALRHVLPRIPKDFAAGIVIVQHMPESFTAMLAKWLNEMCEVDVLEARDGDKIVPGRVLIAPGNAHLKVRRIGAMAEVVLERGALVSGHMPSVDVLFRSVAEQFGDRVTAVIMTGMGSDGVVGMGEIKKAGGHTIAQNQESCAIFGMPKVAIERGCVDKVIPLTEIASHLISSVGRLSSLEVMSHAELG